jgi:hypothetical protein
MVSIAEIHGRRCASGVRHDRHQANTDTAQLFLQEEQAMASTITIRRHSDAIGSDLAALKRRQLTSPSRLAASEPDGTLMLVEPFAHDHLEANLNPVGWMYYAASTLVCTPNALSQEVGLALGAQAREARLREVVTAAGFTRFRRAPP